jgi:hypothetical protein
MQETTCKLEGCEGAKAQLGWCTMHYQRFKKYGDPGPVGPYRRRAHTGICEVEGCERQYKGHGLCDMHIRRKRKLGDVGLAETLRRRNVGLCSAEDCPHPSRSRGMCGSHYAQFMAGRPVGPVKALWRGKGLDRDENGFKQCRRCLEWCGTDQYSANQKTPDRLGQYCHKCTRAYRMKTLYGITQDLYDAILARQGGVCAICSTCIPSSHRKYFFVDHDHSCCPGLKSCGKCVRGLLCSSCNSGMGQLGDDPVRLEAAATYLRSGGTVSGLS